MLLEDLLNLFPIWYSPDDNGGNGDGEDADDDNSSEEEEEDFDPLSVDPEDDDFDKDLAIRTIRKQREDWKETKKQNRELAKEIAKLKKAKEDEEKSAIELAKETAQTSTARAEKAEAALKDERIRSAIIRVAAIEGMRDPDDAYLNLKDGGEIEFEDEDAMIVDMDSVKNAIAILKEDKPYLFELEQEELENDDDPGGSPLRKRVRSRIKKAEREAAEKKKSARDVEIPEVIVSKSL